MSWFSLFRSHNKTLDPAPNPAPNPELEHPWRPVTWSEDNKDQMLRKVKDFQPGTAEVSELKILLYGPIGTGKSSLINSINTVLQGHNTVTALANSVHGQSHSFTLKFKTHRLKNAGPGSFYPFVFIDIMGLEDGSNGIQTNDINKILQGHVKDSYIFNPLKMIDKEDPNYIKHPDLKDRVHCLVSVLPADKISMMSDKVMQKMRDVRQKANDLGIPQVVVMPRVDISCPLVSRNPRKIYTSKKVKEKMKECSHKLGVPMNCIYPVQNYYEQITNDMDMDILILMAMTDIVRFANDYIEDQVYNKSKPK
ncbi:interferon-induced protein 44-like [Clarias gariepinus]|uniref:interferon-induced protein 44-like n=1 Tax=Clarias gariepinus TaxID=13013 RepID=UPI00234C324F|nr:interferon-induced protein 44-like [Clarias gariepinus]